MIKIDDFQKLEIKIGKIIEAEEIEKSEKLLLLKVDIGNEVRQLLAGIKKIYSPESLIGKEIVVLTNLEPKKLMGYESQGMLLAAHDENGNPVLLVPEKETFPGSKIS